MLRVGKMLWRYGTASIYYWVGIILWCNVVYPLTTYTSFTWSMSWCWLWTDGQSNTKCCVWRGKNVMDGHWVPSSPIFLFSHVFLFFQKGVYFFYSYALKSRTKVINSLPTDTASIMIGCTLYVDKISSYEELTSFSFNLGIITLFWHMSIQFPLLLH